MNIDNVKWLIEKVGVPIAIAVYLAFQLEQSRKDRINEENARRAEVASIVESFRACCPRMKTIPAVDRE